MTADRGTDPRIYNVSYELRVTVVVDQENFIFEFCLFNDVILLLLVFVVVYGGQFLVTLAQSLSVN